MQFFRYLFTKLMGKKVILTGKCTKCGTCCKNFYVKSKGSWIKSKERFQKVIIDFPGYERLEISGQDKKGYLRFTCSWLMPDGSCKDHQNRLEICRDYPNKSRYYRNKQMPAYCGFKIIATKPFERVLKKAVKKKS